jgi:3-deoxy-D-manno-octulosonic-acid transferase
MAQSPQQEPFLPVLAGKLAAAYTRFVKASSKVSIDPPDARERVHALHPYILAMWHGQFVMMPTLDQGEYPVSAIAARHRDAAALRSLLGSFNMRVVQGSGASHRKKDRGGVYALRMATRLLKEGSTFSMTADVPPGPARRAGIGIVTLAKFSGRPIVPFAVATSRFLALPTWSRMTINLPFSRMTYVIGDPIWVPSDADEATLERLRGDVEQALNRVTERAYALVGGNLARATPPPPPAPATGPEPESTTIKVYRAGTSLLRAGAPLLLAARERHGKEDPARRAERYGLASALRPEGPLMWMHAASVGETNAILPVIDRLLAERPDLHVLLTTGTITSSALAKRRLSSRAIHQFITLDVPEYVATFLDQWKPDLAVFAESEIWPNLIVEASRRAIPMALVNARMSSRSYRRWKRFKSLSRPLFSRFDIVLAQNDTLARAFREIGARKAVGIGNLKIDAPPPPLNQDELERLRVAFNGRRLWVAASTHDKEEEIVAAAHRSAAGRIPGLCTIIAPRHPERGRTICAALRASGLRVAQRSAQEMPDAATDIYVADTIGELGTLYALADVAFVGGSFVSRGGQNPIEPIGHGAAVLTGPHWENFRDIYQALLRHKGVKEVASAEELAAAVAQLLTDETELARMRQGAKAALKTLAGALDRTVEALAALLPAAGADVCCASQ